MAAAIPFSVSSWEVCHRFESLLAVQSRHNSHKDWLWRHILQQQQQREEEEDEKSDPEEDSNGSPSSFIWNPERSLSDSTPDSIHTPRDEQLSLCSSIWLHPEVQSPTVSAPKSCLSTGENASFPSTIVQESELVKHCLYALEGVSSAILQLEKLSRNYAYQAADRSSHRLSTLWQMSATTCALGKLLGVVASAGRLRSQLEYFVDFFLKPGRQGHRYVTGKSNSGAQGKPKKKKNSKGRGKMQICDKIGRNSQPPYSLVNQAFASAIKCILRGHLAALNTLAASISLRRLESCQGSTGNTYIVKDGDGPVIGLGCEEITLLELYLHTTDLRLQLLALAKLCLAAEKVKPSDSNKGDYYFKDSLTISPDEVSTFKDLSTSSISVDKFPQGANLLSYLYNQLKDADPLHTELLRFLFSRAYQPYSTFIRSWIYHATVNDPFEEFIVDETHGKVREGVVLPCFLTQVCTPLIRAGQQLQVLVNLAESGTSSSGSLSSLSVNQNWLANLKDVLRCWAYPSRNNFTHAPVLVFEKLKLEELMKERKKTDDDLLQKFGLLFEKSSVTDSDPSEEQSNVDTSSILSRANSYQTLAIENISVPCGEERPIDVCNISTEEITGENCGGQDGIKHSDIKEASGAEDGRHGIESPRGVNWLTDLHFSEDTEITSVPEKPLEKLEVPLQVVVDQCIIREIFSQYRRVSSFTVRLLHDFFGLQDHFATLRRYFFMETGDWAENFVAALYQHEWSPVTAQQRQLEVQLMLEKSLNRSSCEADVYRERLYVQFEGSCSRNASEDKLISCDEDDFSSVLINPNRLDSFDIITLGYKLEWPINLILTSEALRLYNIIFRFLIHTKLSVHALDDIWRLLKVLQQSLNSGVDSVARKQNAEKFRTLMIFRHQIGHFMTTLQHYVQSEVLHVVWSRFQRVMHDGVKDMHDLEAFHHCYLNDALHECFLSEEMVSVKSCIDNIMQCLLDFRSCLHYTRNRSKSCEDNQDIGGFYCTVLDIKLVFDRNMLQLYNLQLVSEAHKKISLSRFWMCLDYNGFLADSYTKS